jgi:hypothetical protein
MHPKRLMMHGWKALIAKLNIVEDLQAALAPFAEWSSRDASDIDGLNREAEISGSE